MEESREEEPYKNLCTFLLLYTHSYFVVSFTKNLGTSPKEEVGIIRREKYYFTSVIIFEKEVRMKVFPLKSAYMKRNCWIKSKWDVIENT